MAILGKLGLGLVGLAAAATGGFFVLRQQSQKGSAPGLVDGSLAPCPSSPNCVSSEADTPEEKRVEPLPIESWDALPGILADMGGEIKASSEAYVAAEFTSATFGFVDDLELRRAENAVHVRSASRVGYSDRGVNAARVAELRERIARQAGMPSSR